MALRWTAAAMHEANKGFRRLKAFSGNFRPYEPCLLLTMKRKQTATLLPKTRRPLNFFHGSDRFASSTECGQFRQPEGQKL
jgi:hypothetical protein